MDWPQEILKTGTLEVQFPAIWSLNFCCSFSNLTGFGGPMVQEHCKKLHLWQKVGGGRWHGPSSAVPALS